MVAPITQVLEEHTAVLKLNRPPVNALSKNLLNVLDTLVDETCHNDEIRAVVITSFSHEYFVAGADIKELQEISNRADGQKYGLRGE